MTKTADTAKLKPSKTLTTLLLDRSGSMGNLHAQTITAINGWLGELRGSGEDIRLSFIQFDHHAGEISLEKVHVARRIAEVPDLKPADFQPRGGTPLIDAAMDTIHAIATSLEGPRGDGVKVVIAIQTDGWENASRRYRWDDLKSEIGRREKAGWEFVFMGAGLGKDTYEMGERMGISAEKTISYGIDMEETRAAFQATAQNTVAYASGAMRSMAYSAVQKSASGDREDAAAMAALAPAAPGYAAPQGIVPAGHAAPFAGLGLRGMGRNPQVQNPFWAGLAAQAAPDAPVADEGEAAVARTQIFSAEISAALDGAGQGARP